MQRLMREIIKIEKFKEDSLQVRFKTYTMRLEDMPLDIGYASQKVLLHDGDAKECSIGGHTGETQLIITLPFIDEALLDEMQKISEILPQSQEHKILTYIVVANSSHKKVQLQNIQFLIDSQEEFADMYGVKLTGEPYHNELTKALILISKDGAIYYDQFCDDLDDAFNTDILYRKILAAQLCYTGKGCHE